MRTHNRSGFTLVELLVVVAIIAILASIIAVALPRALERAKIARMTGALDQLRISLTQYYSDHSTYPPPYGTRYFGSRFADPNDLSVDLAKIYQINNFMAAMGLYDEDRYDEFSQGYSTSLEQSTGLSLLEFAPVATQGVSSFSYNPEVYNEIYTGNNLGSAVAEQLSEDRRPFIYVAVNQRQFQRAKTYWLRNNDFLATTWDTTQANSELAGLQFPPPNYDTFVLIGVGPGGDSFGLVDDPPFLNQIPQEDRYYVAALRTYFLATRDLNGNGELDFHFQSRTSQAEGRAEYTFNNDRTNTQVDVAAAIQPFFASSGIAPGEILPNSLPTFRAPNGYGPYIYVSP
jgi:prepilin-type N-terminal cleavage/methylation domain-containing protein